MVIELAESDDDVGIIRSDPGNELLRTFALGGLVERRNLGQVRKEVALAGIGGAGTHDIVHDGKGVIDQSDTDPLISTADRLLPGQDDRIKMILDDTVEWDEASSLIKAWGR